MSRVSLTLVGIVALGCTPTPTRTIDELCTELDAVCSESCGYRLERDECIVDGQQLRQRAEDAECNSAFDEYFDCVDEAGCAWGGCAELRTTLDGCVAAGTPSR